MGLDRIRDRLGDEADPCPRAVEGPGEVHVLGHRPRRPAAGRAQLGGPVDGEAARGDQRLAEGVLDPLEEAEREQVLDVAAALPDGPHVPRKHEAAGRGDLGSSSAGSSFSIASGASVVSASTAITNSVSTRSRANDLGAGLRPGVLGRADRRSPRPPRRPRRSRRSSSRRRRGPRAGASVWLEERVRRSRRPWPPRCRQGRSPSAAERCFGARTKNGHGAPK